MRVYSCSSGLLQNKTRLLRPESSLSLDALLPRRRANGSLMQELDDPFTYPDNLGVAICHSYMKVFVPDMRSQGCPNLTFADAIQACTLLEIVLHPLVAEAAKTVNDYLLLVTPHWGHLHDKSLLSLLGHHRCAESFYSVERDQSTNLHLITAMCLKEHRFCIKHEWSSK